MTSGGALDPINSTHQGYSLLGLLVQLAAVSIHDLVGVMVRGQEAHIVHLSPASLLGPNEAIPGPEEGLEGGRP